MGIVKIHDDILSDIADAIREKTGESGLIAPNEMAEEISGIISGNASVRIPPILVCSDGTNASPPLIDDWIGPFGSAQSAFYPSTISGERLIIDWRLPFEMHMRVKVNNTYSNSQVICGSMSGFYNAPTIEFSPNLAGIFCGFTTNGTSWTNGLYFSADNEIAIRVGSDIVIDAIYDGTDYVVTIIDSDGHTVSKSSTPSGAHYYTGDAFEFGDIARSSGHYGKFIQLYLPDMYIKNNGSLVWGSKKILMARGARF